MYIGQITAATCWLDLLISAPVTVTLDSCRSINPPAPSLCTLPVSLPSSLSLSSLPARWCGVSHNQLKTLSCAWVPVMSVRLCSFISLSVRLFVRLRPSIICPSVSLSVRLSVRSSVICLSLCPSVCHLSRVSLCPFLCPSVSLSVSPSVSYPVRLCQFVSLSVRLSVRLCPSVCHPSVSLFSMFFALSLACSRRPCSSL